MGIFSKNESKDLEQTQEIKEAASMPPSIPLPPSSQTQTQEFVNPFAQEQIQTPTSPITNPQEVQTSPTPSFQQTSNPMEQQTSRTSPFEEAKQQPIQASTSNQMLDEDSIKELIVENVEKIIEERWEKVTTNVESVVQWKDKVEREIDLLKHDIVTIKEGFEQFEKRLLNKINTYDRNILDVNSEIKALEKVFNKITPTLVNNVNELSKIADNLRGVKNETPDEE